jgi:hypothetical protein
MAKDPAFLFYSQDFLVGTYDMTDEQIGRYIKLLCLQHQKGHLKEATMTLIMGGELDECIVCKFLKDDKGNYYNEKLEVEAKRRADYAASRRANLENKRKQKHKELHMEAHMDEHMETEAETVTDTKTSLDESRFNEFWQTYPKKAGKKAALAAWKKAKVSADLHAKILSAVALQKTSAQWQKDNGQFIPNPATWLNQGRWDDEIQNGGKTGKTVIEQQYTQREYDAKDYGGLTPEEVEEASKYDA